MTVIEGIIYFIALVVTSCLMCAAGYKTGEAKADEKWLEAFNHICHDLVEAVKNINEKHNADE